MTQPNPTVIVDGSLPVELVQSGFAQMAIPLWPKTVPEVSIFVLSTPTVIWDTVDVVLSTIVVPPELMGIVVLYGVD